MLALISSLPIALQVWFVAALWAVSYQLLRLVVFRLQRIDKRSDYKIIVPLPVMKVNR